MAKGTTSRPKSIVWSWFERVEERSVKCSICNSVMRYNNTTSTMLRHLRVCHGTETGGSLPNESVVGVPGSSELDNVDNPNGETCRASHGNEVVIEYAAANSNNGSQHLVENVVVTDGNSVSTQLTNMNTQLVVAHVTHPQLSHPHLVNAQLVSHHSNMNSQMSHNNEDMSENNASGQVSNQDEGSNSTPATSKRRKLAIRSSQQKFHGKQATVADLIAASNMTSSGSTTPSRVQQPEELDGDDHFARHVAEELRKLPQGYVKNKAKLKIQEILLEFSCQQTGNSSLQYAQIQVV